MVHVEFDSELQDELLRENSSVADAKKLDAVPAQSTCSLNDQLHIKLHKVAGEEG